MPGAAVDAMADVFVLAQMNTNDFIWQGCGRTEDEARAALLAAWAHHRSRVVAQFPDLAARLPEAQDMHRHFATRFSTYTVGGGYRDDDRLV
jgi:hypothetical protein